MARFQEYESPIDPAESAAEHIDYGRNWGNAENGDIGFLRSDETIVTSVWVITCDQEPTPTLVLASEGEGIALDDLSTYIWLTGGTKGLWYKLTNKITTIDSQFNSRTESMTGLLLCATK
jgi:hypothetical protein